MTAARDALGDPAPDDRIASLTADLQQIVFEDAPLALQTLESFVDAAEAGDAMRAPYHREAMGWLRALFAVVALAFGAAALVASAPAPLGAVAAAHPEPGDEDGDLDQDRRRQLPEHAERHAAQHGR